MPGRPELPFLAAGSIAVAGATLRDGKFPALGRPALGVVALVLIASATINTRVAPLIHALGLLILLATVMGATKIVYGKARAKRKK